MLTFARLTRSHELVVTRAAGVSVWQFLTPPLVVATLLGTFVMAVFNPISSAMVYRFEQIEAKHIRGKPSLLAVSPSGLWLREGGADEQVVIHALGVSQQGLELRDVIISFTKATIVSQAESTLTRQALPQAGGVSTTPW